MDEEIGIAAGIVWRELAARGLLTTAKLEAGTKLRESMLFMALGWLAREGWCIGQPASR
jgi:hypothetical protein